VAVLKNERIPKNQLSLHRETIVFSANANKDKLHIIRN